MLISKKIRSDFKHKRMLSEVLMHIYTYDLFYYEFLTDEDHLDD